MADGISNWGMKEFKEFLTENAKVNKEQIKDLDFTTIFGDIDGILLDTIDDAQIDNEEIAEYFNKNYGVDIEDEFLEAWEAISGDDNVLTYDEVVTLTNEEKGLVEVQSTQAVEETTTPENQNFYSTDSRILEKDDGTKYVKVEAWSREKGNNGSLNGIISHSYDLEEIAQSTGKTVAQVRQTILDSIVSTNGIKDPNLIYPNQEITLVDANGLFEMTTTSNVEIEEQDGTVVEEQDDTVVEEKDDTVVEEKDDTVVEDKDDTVVEEKDDTVVEDKDDTVVEEKDDTVVEDKGGTVADSSLSETAQVVLDDILNKIKTIEVGTSDSWSYNETLKSEIKNTMANLLINENISFEEKINVLSYIQESGDIGSIITYEFMNSFDPRINTEEGLLTTADAIWNGLSNLNKGNSSITKILDITNNITKLIRGNNPNNESTISDYFNFMLNEDEQKNYAKWITDLYKNTSAYEVKKLNETFSTKETLQYLVSGKNEDEIMNNLFINLLSDKKANAERLYGDIAVERQDSLTNTYVTNKSGKNKNTLTGILDAYKNNEISKKEVLFLLTQFEPSDLATALRDINLNKNEEKYFKEFLGIFEP